MQKPASGSGTPTWRQRRGSSRWTNSFNRKKVSCRQKLGGTSAILSRVQRSLPWPSETAKVWRPTSNQVSWNSKDSHRISVFVQLWSLKMWSPPRPLSPSWRLWILLHIWMKEMFAWSRAKHQEPSVSALWTWTPTRYQNRLHLVMVFNVHADPVAFLLEFFSLFSTASEAFGWTSHQAQPALCWWS